MSRDYQHTSLRLHYLRLALIIMSSVLVGIWAVRDTIALRNILLVTGSLTATIFIYYFFCLYEIRKIGFYIFPLLCIVFTFVWVLVHYFFLSIDPQIQFHELTATWFRTALASIMGLATGLALVKYPRALYLFWGAIFLTFVILFTQYLPEAVKLENLFVPYQTSDFTKYLYYGKINPMFMGVLLIAGATGLFLDAVRSNYSWQIKMASLFWLTCLFISLYSFAFIINTRSGILLSCLLILAWCIFGLIWLIYKKGLKFHIQSPGFRALAAVILIAIFSIGFFTREQIQRDSGWSQLKEDISIAFQIEKYPHWRNMAQYGFPTTETGKLVTFNTYQRVAWATAGVRTIFYQPLGAGVLYLPMGLAPQAQDLFPGITRLSTHSGWVDLGLSFGIPILVFMWLANLSIFYFAILQKSAFQCTLVTLSATLFVLFLVGELSYGHPLEMLFYFYSLMSGILIANLHLVND